MHRTLSLEQVNNTSLVSNARNNKQRISPDRVQCKRKPVTNFGNFAERYCIIVKPKLHRSSSLSDLTTYCSDINLTTYYNKETKLLSYNYGGNIYDSAGDAEKIFYKRYKKRNTCPYMSFNAKIRKPKKKIDVLTDFNAKVGQSYCYESETEHLEPNMSSCAEYSSVYSVDQSSTQRGAAFPFKSTPSGNLKVQSNQVVFQSSTVGVLLADPTQAKVKVKFEGKNSSEVDTEHTQYEDKHVIVHDYAVKELQNRSSVPSHKHKKQMSPGIREDKGKDLNSLGYALFEPIDWLRIQLPKKQELYQEFYRRVHNFINTDTVIHIGEEEFHCHRLVLQIYSPYFDTNLGREIDVPSNNVSAETFQTIYEWMMFNGSESHKVLKRNNILDVFLGAQFLAIKDLEEQCWSFIVNESIFNEDTAFALFRDARLKGITPVMELMVPRVMRFFLPLVASTDFLELDVEEITIFLRSNYICVSCEIEVLMAGVRWLYGDWPARRKHTVEVMRCIRFGLISPWQLVDIKRNPDNAEILEIVNETEVQQMVDDGLAYVIIKYWYGNNSKNYYHWIDVLGLSEPAERNWLGEEKNHVTYKDFLKYLEQFMVPKDQMYQQMSMMQQARRTDDVPGTFRGGDNDKIEMRRPKMDFPLPVALKGLAGDKEKSFPTMSEFFENRKMRDKSPVPSASRSPSPEFGGVSQNDSKRKPHNLESIHHKHQKCENSELHMKKINSQFYKEAERDTSVEGLTSKENESETSSDTGDTSDTYKGSVVRHRDGKRHSAAASYLAAATAALGSTIQKPVTVQRLETVGNTNKETRPTPSESRNDIFTQQISLFNHSKESLARMNMNKLSTSILGPSNKNYITEGSLFNWDRETVLVFGGTDPHTPYGIGKNTGKDVYRFDPVTNVWDYVGDLPEPRYHHAVAFLRGRVYLVGGADPRDDDIRGKSVVVSTVWSYEPVRRAWYSESGLSVPRKNFGLVVHRMALYAIGGQDKKGRVLRSVEKFDPKSSTWSEVQPMSLARMGVAATKYRDYIWVAGGMTGERKKPLCRVVECYNSKTDEWTEIHSLRFPRCFATLFAMNDTLYLIGGAGRISDKEKTTSSIGAIDIWDWKDRQWKQLTEMSNPRHGHALAYLGTQLIIIGGVTTIYMRALNNVESYCCERGAWIRGVASLATPLSGHGAVTLPPASLM